jgi:hypothetical protein
MTTQNTDDHLRDYFQTVIPTSFPPCPATDNVLSSVRSSGTRRTARMSQWAMALAACVLLAIGLTVTASLNNPKPVADDHGLLKNATANGKGLKTNASKK